MRLVDGYFEAALGLPVDGVGRCVRTPLRSEAQPPFAAYPAAQLIREGVTYRSLSPDLPDGAESLPFTAFGLREQRLVVLYPPADWTPVAPSEASPLAEGALVAGGARLPKGGRAFGIARGERYVGWAAAMLTGAVWSVVVETDPAHRRQGIALACLTALTEDLAGIGGTALYLCEERNAASRALAQAAGYVLYGEWIRGLVR